MAHNLKLFIEDVFQDPKYIRVGDNSVYDELLPVTNRVFKIDIPGQQIYKLIKLPVGGYFTYTSKSLKISKNVEDLPDGLWEFTLSVCPNEKVYTKVYHFRTVALEMNLYNLISIVLGGKIESNVNDILISCLLKIKALKANSLNAYNLQEAYKLYSEIESTINKIKIQ